MGCGCGRRGGGATGCQCGVEAGPNVNITGTGSVDDPWIISASGEVSDTLIQVSDTTSINLTISGDGSVGDPYVISGVLVETSVNVSDSTSIDFTRSGSGTPADPYIITGSVRSNILAVSDTDTLNLTLTGTGTNADPWTISGVVDIDLTVQDTTTLNLTLTGSGTDADPWILSGEVTPTEFAVNNAPPSGYVELALSGDGSPGNPWLLEADESIIRRELRSVLPKYGSATLDTSGTTTATSTGTATAVNYDATTKYGRARKMEQLVTVAATNAVAGYRNADASAVRGNAADVGGFYFKTMFGPATGVATTTSRLFSGLTAATGAPTDVEPSSLTDMVGVGYDAADTNVQFMHNDNAGSATKVDLGGSFPVPTVDRTALYSLEIWCLPNASTIEWRLVDVISGAAAAGSVNTNLPTATTALTPRGYASAGGTSSVIGFAFGGYLLNSSERFG